MFHMGVLMLFSYFDKIFRLVGFGFDFDDFQFWADGRVGDAFSQAFLWFWKQIQNIGR